MILLLASLIAPLPAFAADNSADLIASGLKMLAGLAVVVGLLYLIYALSRKGIGFFHGSQGNLINIVEVRSLGAKKGLCLVEVRGQELLLGFGPDRIECLARLEAAPVTENFASQLQTAREGEQ